MKIETKTYVIIILTLVIGMIIGSLITGAFVRHRVGRFMSMGEPGHMVGFLERMIGPDDSQREAVRAVLHKHSERFWKIHSQFEAEMLALRDSLKKDLDPILTEEQKRRLERQPKPPRPLGERKPGSWRGREPGWPPTPDEERPPGPPPGDDD